MNKSVILRFGVLLGLGAVLSACGGGSSGSKNQNTPSSSSVATSQSSSSLSSNSSISSSEPSTTKLTLQGRAVAEALAGGKVVFSIGSLAYETTIDDSLKYNITLDVPAENTNQPFVAVATGSGADAWVQFAASYPSVTSLAEKAGGDGILTAEEYFGVNITALTTAQYAEMKNQLISVDSDESRKNAFFAMHPIKSLEKSTSVSRMLSDIDFKLPAPAKTTLEFLLDENLSETYNEAFRFYDNTLISTQIDLFKSDPLQSVVSSKKLSGTYFVESSNYNYLLTFNEDGTGNLQAAALGGVITWDELPAINADFTWVRKGRQVRITPSQPLVQNVNYYIDHGGFYYSCNVYYYQMNEACRVTYEYFDIELIADIDAGRFANVRPRIKVESESGYIYTYISPSELSQIISANDLSPITESDLTGQEWYTSDHSYAFDENGTVLKTNLSTKNTESSVWELNGARLVIAEETLWFSAKDLAGYSVISVVDSRVTRKSMYKRTQVNISESDWVGRWTTYPHDKFSYSHDVNVDKTWRDGFEAEGAGSWSIINNHTQSAISNGAWRMQRDVLAIHGDKYYMSVCQGEEAEIFVPYNCYLSVATKAANFDTAGFWGSWSYPAFNEKNSGQNWIPLGGSILQTIENTGNISTEYIRVASNKLLNRYDLTILEMTNAGKDEIELCEYKLFEDCTESEKRVYLRGIEVKLTVSGEGDVLMRHESYLLEGGYTTTYERSVANMLMVPKGYPQKLIIKPDAGGVLNSDAVSGCGGTLVGEIYSIPALVEPCEITVNF